MLCGCTGLSSAAKAQADDTYSKDDSGVYTGGEDNMSLIKAPVSAHKKAVVGRGGSFLKSDQAYPGCFNWNKGFSRRSMDDLDMYGNLSPMVIQAAERSSLSDLRKAPSIPVMEVHDPSCGLHVQSQENLAWASRMYQPYKGQLKMAVYVNCGLLTVHVKQARQLSSSFGADCNSFVKLSLSPDETKRTKCRTSVVSGTDIPEYDEKFSFELLEGDMKKRLLISLWHKESPHSHSELLGCMSFGIRHIVQKKSEVDGWYFLLSDAVGKRKHLQVGSQHQQKLNNSITQTSEEDSEKTDSNRIVLSDSSHDNTTEMLTITLSKGQGGFGFQVGGDRPAIIQKIQEDSISEQAGLLPGDNIIKIDEHDVSNLSSDTVARILKQCQGSVKLGIYRNKKPPDILQDTISPHNNQGNSLFMNSKEFMPSALPNKFKFDGMVKPATSHARETKALSTGSTVNGQRVMMPANSPISGRRHTKPSGSPVVDRRPMKPRGSPVVERRPLKPAGSPIAERRIHDNVIAVSSSPVSSRRHSQRSPDHSANGISSYHVSNGVPQSHQRQRMSSPLREQRYSSGSPPTSRRDVVNVSEEIRNGQNRGVVFRSSRTNGTHHDQVQNYVNNLPPGGPQYSTNSSDANTQQGYQVAPTSVQSPEGHKLNSEYQYESEYSRNPIPRTNGHSNPVRTSMIEGEQYPDSFTESHIPSHLLQNHTSSPLTHSGNTHIPQHTNDARLYNSQTQYTLNCDTNDRQNRRIPNCDDSSSEDDNFYGYRNTSAGVNSQITQPHHQHTNMSSAYQGTPYKVSSF